MIEQRRHARAPINAQLNFFVKGQPERRDGLAKDISVGGMSIETSLAPRFGAEVIVHVELPGATEPLVLPGVVRWVRGGAIGVQFGLLGAIETHAITELTRHDKED